MRFRVRRDLQYVDGLLVAGSVVDEVPDAELKPPDAEGLKRQRAHAKHDQRLLVVWWNERVRIVVAGKDVEPVLPGGLANRGGRR